MEEDMTKVADNIDNAMNNKDVSVAEETIVQTTASTINILIKEEEAAINSYNTFLDNANKELDKKLYDAIKFEIDEIIADEKEHIEKLKTIQDEMNDGYNNVEKVNENYSKLEEENKEHLVKVYMNTWENYNKNGANVDEINGGWYIPSEALNWAQDMINKGEEPFINDVDDNLGIPFEITEYDDVVSTLNDVIQYCDLEDYDRKVIGAISESGNVSTYAEAVKVFNNGNFTFYSNVNNDYDLGQADILENGGIFATLDADSILSYIDEDEMLDSWDYDLRTQYADENGVDIDDIDDDDFEEFAHDVINEEIAIAIADENEDYISEFFDYEAYGRNLSYDFIYTSYGAISIY